jgi:hypothetical protein
MRSFRFTIASLSIAVALVALDIVWIKSLLTTHRSIFGFAVEGLDMGLFLMATVLPFGLRPMLTRRGEGRRFWVRFEVGGLAAALAYAAYARLAPDALQATAHVILEPIWNLLFGWVRNDGIVGLVITMGFLITGLGAPQLLVAVLFGIGVRRGANRGVSAASAGSEPANTVPPPIAPGVPTASETSVFPRVRVIGTILSLVTVPQN